MRRFVRSIVRKKWKEKDEGNHRHPLGKHPHPLGKHPHPRRRRRRGRRGGRRGQKEGKEGRERRVGYHHLRPHPSRRGRRKQKKQKKPRVTHPRPLPPLHPHLHPRLHPHAPLHLHHHPLLHLHLAALILHPFGSRYRVESISSLHNYRVLESRGTIIDRPTPHHNHTIIPSYHHAIMPSDYAILKCPYSLVSSDFACPKHYAPSTSLITLYIP
jgi:hypothetical protein